MENKLTLEHLAPYLPYGLKLYHVGYKAKHILDTSIKEGVYDREMSAVTLTAMVNGNEYLKPILHPLSDLTKEIEHNGEKFVPIDYINGEFRLEIPNKIELQNWVKNISIHFVLAEWVGIEDLYKLFKLLFQWHFDVFGLINKGLAIDINTLNN